MRNAGRRGAGLVLKFSLLIVALVIVIVTVVAVTLLWQVVPRERQMLAEGLRNRARILLESVALRAAAPIRTGESGYIPVAEFLAEISAMPAEALSLTISGPSTPIAEDPADRDYLWATNDPSMASATFNPATLRVSDARLERGRAADIARSVNAAAAAKLRGETDAAVVDLLLQEVAADEAAGHSGTVPAFDPEKLAPEYLFYRPLVTPDEKGAYFTGLVRLTVTTAKVSAQLSESIQTIVTTTGWIALIAVAMGVVGAVVLANLAITPISRLVKAVSSISATEDKKTLRNIPVGARDEIGTLAETVNEMIDGLVTAAKDEEQMLVGRAIQKQFLPLEAGPDGEKGSTGGITSAVIDLYAFYEGAATVSGDYFDWQKLDDRYYALIKCDVSGHGAPAAFIMVEVATLFLRWCREWKARLASLPALRSPEERERVRKEFLRLDSLAYTVNDMIEERGFKEIFAAFMVCVYDTRDGRLTLCPVGDNRMYYYDSRKGGMVTRRIMNGGPAAGQLKDEEVRRRGYPTVEQQLERGDVLVMFTDGFEEARRQFRDAGGNPVTCDAPGLRVHDDHLGTHEFGWDYEELTVKRILDIFDAFFGRRVYRLERHHLPAPEEIEFDFSKRSDSLEEAVLALVAVERIYRTYRDPSTGPENKIRIEKKVHEYLKKYFRQYDKYYNSYNNAETPGSYISISNIKEDKQRDDLTILMLRRP